MDSITVASRWIDKIHDGDAAHAKRLLALYQLKVAEELHGIERDLFYRCFEPAPKPAFGLDRRPLAVDLRRRFLHEEPRPGERAPAARAGAGGGAVHRLRRRRQRRRPQADVHRAAGDAPVGAADVRAPGLRSADEGPPSRRRDDEAGSLSER